MSGGGAPEDQRSAGCPSVVGPSLADWAGDSNHSTSLLLHLLPLSCCLPEGLCVPRTVTSLFLPLLFFF